MTNSTKESANILVKENQRLQDKIESLNDENNQLLKLVSNIKKLIEESYVRIYKTTND